MGIASTTSRANVDALLSFHLGRSWRDGFATVVCGEDVRLKKPDPAVYVLALRQLGESPLCVVAVEDSPAGVAAAREAEVPVLVTRSAYFDGATLEDAIAIGPGLHERRGWRPELRAAGQAAARVTWDDVEDWYTRMEAVSQFA